MGDEQLASDQRPDEWERSERASYWIALAIALVPIPAALLISWALGSPPWKPRPAPSGVLEAPAHPAEPAPHR